MLASEHPSLYSFYIALTPLIESSRAKRDKCYEFCQRIWKDTDTLFCAYKTHLLIAICSFFCERELIPLDECVCGVLTGSAAGRRHARVRATIKTRLQKSRGGTWSRDGLWSHAWPCRSASRLDERPRRLGLLLPIEDVPAAGKNTRLSADGVRRWRAVRRQIVLLLNDDVVLITWCWN